MDTLSSLFPPRAGSSAPTQREASPGKAQGQQRPVVLAIDDNEDSLFLIQCALEGGKTQCQLVLGYSGTEALQLASAHQPRLILLDIHLPDINGIEILRRLRSSKRDRKIPVVAVSASPGPMDPFGISDAGFTDCLAKPYRVSDLEDIVAAYCR